MEHTEEDDSINIVNKLTSFKKERDSLMLEKEKEVQAKDEAQSKFEQVLKDKTDLKLLHQER